MKVLQILHTDETGGIRTLANMIADGLRERGILVETKFLYPAGKVSGARKLLSAVRGAFEIVRSPADVLISYQTTASILCGTFGRLGRWRKRIIHQTAMPWATARPLLLIEKLVGSSSGYTANVMNSHATAAAFEKYPPSYRKSIVLIEHGIKPKAAVKSRTETRTAFGLPVEAPLLLNVGRLTPQKNQKTVIESLKALPAFHFAIAGGGELEAEYRALTNTNGVSDRVHFLGDVSPQDVSNLLRASDMFVFPSTWETFGLAGVEAALAGMPIVASDLPVLREVLGSIENAPVKFAPPFVPGCWVEAIKRLAAERPETTLYARAMTERFSTARMIEKYIGLLNQ